MATAANFSLVNSSYEPFGAGVEFQTFKPVVRLTDKGIRYVGQDCYGVQDIEVGSHKETLDVTHNFANPNRGKDRLHSVLRMPFVEEVDGLNVATDLTTIEFNVGFSRRLPREVKRRAYYLALYLLQNAVSQNAILDSDVPI